MANMLLFPYGKIGSMKIIEFDTIGLVKKLFKQIVAMIHLMIRNIFLLISVSKNFLIDQTLCTLIHCSTIVFKFLNYFQLSTCSNMFFASPIVFSIKIVSPIKSIS